jgi:beta-lactamase regulating signal transducer with metallopeptidase domain
MGGLILFFLFVTAVVILLTPAMQAGGRRSRDEVERAAHEAVLRRIEDHRRRQGAETDPEDPLQDGSSGKGDPTG